jgi:serine/threonine-protein kinase
MLPPTRDCLDDDTLTALVDRRLSGHALQLVARHIDRCAECRRLVADLAQVSVYAGLDANPLANDPPCNGATELLSSGLSSRPAKSAGRGAAQPSSGALAGRYELVREIGRGGMGQVWLSRDVRGQREVAIKIIDSELAKQPQARARFQREARVARRLAHPNVVKVFDEGVTGEGYPYIVMELLRGVSLRGALFGRGRLSCTETAWILSQVCEGLAVAHQAGLVHRDLKPENIFIAGARGERTAKILDFGLAKVVDALAVDRIDPTRTGALLGTPSYMSPEQAMGSKAVDFRTDLWAIGVVTFECLTGTRPFADKRLGRLIAKIATESVPPPSRVDRTAGIPAAVDTWMTRALARDKDARFQSAPELARTFAAAAHARC